MMNFNFNIRNRMRKFSRLKIAVIGGGTGLSSLLMGLKRYNKNISAIVTVTDDGGSSGRLRKEFDIIPPGDIRSCLVSLADKDTLLSKLFNYRFKSYGNELDSLSGHSFGNLFIMAMSDIFGSFEKGISEANKILLTNGQVIPATFEKINLVAEKKYDNNVSKIVYGETQIAKDSGYINDIWIEPKDIKCADIAEKAILSADLIVLGPGSFYTSIITNILIKDIREALIKNKKAKKIFVCNIMEQPGETVGYTTKDYMQILIKYLGENVVDYFLVNDNSKIPINVVEKYKYSNLHPVEDDLTDKDCKNMNIKKVVANLFGDNISKDSIFARHEPIILAKIIKRIFKIY